MKGRAELTAVWALIGLVTVEILVACWRLPWNELYHVTGSGQVGGLSRALLFLNFPVALIAAAVLVYLLDGFDGPGGFLAGRRCSRALRGRPLAEDR